MFLSIEISMKVLSAIAQIALGSYIGFLLAKFSWSIIWNFSYFHFGFLDFRYGFLHNIAMLTGYVFSFIICAGISLITTAFAPWLGGAIGVVSGLGWLLRLLFTLNILPSHL